MENSHAENDSLLHPNVENPPSSFNEDWHFYSCFSSNKLLLPLLLFLLLFNYPTASFGPSEHLAVFEPGTFRFWLQRLNKLNHSSLIEVVLAGNGDEFSIMYVFILFEVAVVENGGDFSIMYIYVFFMIFISILFIYFLI